MIPYCVIISRVNTSVTDCVHLLETWKHERVNLSPKMTDLRLGRVNLKPGKVGLGSEKA